MTADRVLQEQALDALEFDPIDAASIGVSVERGVVTLHGRVQSAADKITAERLVQLLPGVRAVANDLEVSDADRALCDAVIAEAAANALTWYRAAPPGMVHVSVADGWVTLTGTVPRVSERGAAERAVRRLRGVRGVSNAITVSNITHEERAWQS